MMENSHYDTSSFDAMFEGVKQLPATWGPRREQPSWDRDFAGTNDIRQNFKARTDAAHVWMAFALQFSSTLLDGFETKENLINFGSEMRGYIAKGKNQFDN